MLAVELWSVGLPRAELIPTSNGTERWKKIEKRIGGSLNKKTNQCGADFGQLH